MRYDRPSTDGSDAMGGDVRTVAEIVKRQFGPQLEMVRAAVLACPADAFEGGKIGPREHLYHALVGMDVWLTEDVSSFPFDRIVDRDAAELRGPASSAVSRSFLLEYVDRLIAKVDALADDDAALLSPSSARGGEFTLLDRCIAQFRHVQHHVGVVNTMLRERKLPAVRWLGYGEE